MHHLSSFDDEINAAGGGVVRRPRSTGLDGAWRLRELCNRMRWFPAERGKALTGVAGREATKY
jgi:hypothetical protein